MITKKIKKAVSYIFADEENFSLENRLFLSALIIGIFTSIIASIISIIISPSLKTIIICIVLLCLMLTIYYFIRYKKIIEPFKIPMIVIAFICILTIWVFDGGINGSDIIVALVILILSLIGVSDKNKKYILILFLALVIIIYLIQLYRPDLIVNIPSETNRWFDSLITVIYSSVFIFLIIRFVHKNYTLERQRAEESEANLAQAMKIARLGTWKYDIVNDLFTFNDQFYKIFNTTAELEGGYTMSSAQYAQKFVYPDDLYLVGVEIQKALETNDPNYNSQLDHRIICPDGKIGFISVHIKVKKDEYGKTVMTYGVNQDVSERKHAELTIIKQNHELQQLNSDKDLFMSMLAHDLKSPFNSILGFLQLINKNIRKYDIDKIEKQINIIYNSARNVYSLLEDILMWSGSQSGKIPFEPQKLNYTTICNDVVEILRPNAVFKNIIINSFVNGGIEILADKNMFKTILRNLISNAIKFTNKGGRIDIFAEQSNGIATITVSDNGIGIEQDRMIKLFDISHFQTTIGTANEEGTGLGLMLCKEFVERHGGKIWVESQEGKGSQFKFTIPLITE